MATTDQVQWSGSVPPISPFLLGDKHDQIGVLLKGICEELQLSPTKYQLAVDRYESACRWLEAEDSVVASYYPTIYSQGSMRIGTTVKPFGRDAYDLDLVCEFQVAASTFDSPMHLLDLVEYRLRQNSNYARAIERKNRCVRLNYAGEFHLDILPAYPDVSVGGSCILIPDRRSPLMCHSNPKGYSDWFDKQCELALIIFAESRKLMAKAEPIPAQVAASEKAILKQVVQLLKRWRDIRYQKQCDVAPISMVLTTMAAQAYSGEQSVPQALSAILDKIVVATESSKPRVYVLNPANLKEDLSERWEDPVKYRAFVDGIRELRLQWNKILSLSGIQNISNALESLFGETVRTVLEKQGKSVRSLAEKSAVRVAATGVLTTSPISSVALRAHTFHGKK
jgi:hypothetical protein